MNRRNFLYTLILGGLSACDMIKYHPYDGKITGPRNINITNLIRIENATNRKDTIRFAFMSDTHRSYDDLKDFVKHINEHKEFDFVIHGGDIADFGATKEFLWSRDILNELDIPYVALIGNHDCLGNGEQIYRQVFGLENFSFVAANVRFICLNTCALEHDYSNPVPDFTFIEEMISRQEGSNEKTVVVMHAPPYSDQFDNNVARVFQRYCNEFSNVQFFLHGHHHKYTEKDIFGDGLIYYGCANIAKRNYIDFTITPDNYLHEQVYF